VKFFSNFIKTKDTFLKSFETKRNGTGNPYIFAIINSRQGIHSSLIVYIKKRRAGGNKKLIIR
jgi:hypothetical protein